MNGPLTDVPLIHDYGRSSDLDGDAVEHEGIETTRLVGGSSVSGTWIPRWRVGSRDRIRTCDLAIMSRLLCH